MAHKLDRLMQLSGALAAGEFGVGGSLVDYRGDLSKEHAQLIAMMCAANTMMSRMQAEAFTKYTGMNWSPLRGWAVCAGDYCVCVMGEIGLFVETTKADFNEIFKTLGEEAGQPYTQLGH